tara:strand:+ start:582 stop:794 length:213 start_codon:yes stop_codon:yes gene_type:complete
MTKLQLQLFEENLSILKKYFKFHLGISPKYLEKINFIKTHTPECIIVVDSSSTFLYKINCNEEITSEQIC